MNPDSRGFYGTYGGAYIPETLYAPLEEVKKAFFFYKEDSEFQKELSYWQKEYVGRATPLSYAKRLTEYLGGANIYLKRVIHKNQHLYHFRLNLINISS